MTSDTSFIFVKPLEDQITAVKEPCNWACIDLLNIQTIFIPKHEILQMQKTLHPQFVTVTAISGTRDYH